MGAVTFAGFVGEVDELAAVSAVDVEQRFRELEVARRRVEAEQAVLLASIEESGSFRADGHSSVFGLLRAVPHWSEAECRSRTKLARLIAAYPSVGEALWDGRISVANADSIARLFANPGVADRFESVLGNLLTEAEVSEHDDFKRLPERWELLVDRAARDQRADLDRDRSVRFTLRNGRGRLVVEWGDFDTAKNLEIFEQFVDAEFEADWKLAVERFGEQASVELLPRTEQQRRADAMTAIFERAVSTPVGSKAPKPVGVVHVDWWSAQELMIEAGLFPERHTIDPFDDPTPLVSQMRCETTDGAIINPDRVLQVLLDGYVRFVIHDRDGVPISWGRQRRLFEGAARDAVLCLSHRCTHPGCRVTANRAEIDHMTPFSEGGTTDPGNGCPDCRRHNHLKYRRRWRTTRGTDGHFHTYRPDGTEIR